MRSNLWPQQAAAPGTNRSINKKIPTRTPTGKTSKAQTSEESDLRIVIGRGAAIGRKPVVDPDLLRGVDHGKCSDMKLAALPEHRFNVALHHRFVALKLRHIVWKKGGSRR